jgi:hypothetical protein
VRLCKPSSVPALRRAAIIYLGQPLPTGSPAPQRRSASGLREATYPPAERPQPLAPGPSPAFADRLLGLAGGGVFPAGDVTAAAVRSYRTISPLPEPFKAPKERRRAIGRVFSVALSLGSPDPTCDLSPMGTGSRWPLATTAPCPARTFLPASHYAKQSDRPSRPWDLRFTIYD